MALPSSARVQTRRLILTGGIAAIVFVGSIYGAGLKIQGEIKNEQKTITEASIDEQIAVLEERRKYLASQRAPFERKLNNLYARLAKDAAAAGPPARDTVVAPKQPPAVASAADADAAEEAKPAPPQPPPPSSWWPSR